MFAIRNTLNSYRFVEYKLPKQFILVNKADFVFFVWISAKIKPKLSQERVLSMSFDIDNENIIPGIMFAIKNTINQQDLMQFGQPKDVILADIVDFSPFLLNLGLKKQPGALFFEILPESCYFMARQVICRRTKPLCF